MVLAAGRSSRMGRPKALLRLAGRPFVAHLACTFLDAGAHRVLIVASGETQPDIAAAVGAMGTVVVNPQPDRGQLSSVQTALAALGSSVEAVLVAPVDQPLIQPATVEALLRTWRDSRAPVVRPLHRDGRHGHPVLVSRPVIQALLTADANQTMRTVIQSFGERIVDVLVDDEGAFRDVDTWEEYLELARRRSGRNGRS